jgi:predicted 3-demethylubiquinone-9 3-methyltransferase (glyoxalase superfamily)
VLAGQRYQALNGGPNENACFNESISLSVTCEDQTEIDHYWEEAVGAGRSRTQADPSESASGIRPPHTLKK